MMACVSTHLSYTDLVAIFGRIPIASAVSIQVRTTLFVFPEILKMRKRGRKLYSSSPESNTISREMVMGIGWGGGSAGGKRGIREPHPNASMASNPIGIGIHGPNHYVSLRMAALKEGEKGCLLPITGLEPAPAVTSHVSSVAHVRMA